MHRENKQYFGHHPASKGSASGLQRTTKKSTGKSPVLCCGAEQEARAPGRREGPNLRKHSWGFSKAFSFSYISHPDSNTLTEHEPPAQVRGLQKMLFLLPSAAGDIQSKLPHQDRFSLSALPFREAVAF